VTLIACHECDMLHRKVSLPAGTVARCGRCGCTLYRHSPERTDRHLAMVLGALIVFVIANAFPILTLELQGYRHGSTLIGAVRTLFQADMDVVALLVLLTAVIFPLTELLLLLFVLLALRTGQGGAELHRALRWLSQVRPWVMLDVFLMAVLVALAKLANTATVIPGIALWALVALAFLMAAVAAIDSRELWQHLPAMRAGRRRP